MSNQFLGIIPARYASTRFPGKPLAILGNKPMIQWVYERASEVFSHLAVATDDQRIMEAVKNFGGRALLTSDSHSTGTERCSEALDLILKQQPGSITHVVNIQGDEPLLQQDHLEVLKECFRDQETQIATLVRPLENMHELSDPNVVKAVIDQKGWALYFSRAPIPHVRDTPAGQDNRHAFYAHMGLYAFRAETLKRVVGLPATPLEKAESLEQLRWLEHGYSIRTRITQHPSMGVDTPEDLDKIRTLIENQSTYS